MVYNAMKLFMEVNPQLFDDCSHEYAEHQNNAEVRQQARSDKWAAIADLAKARQNGKVPPKLPATTTQGNKVSSPMRLDDTDPLSQESSRRLEALRLQDDSVPGRERRAKDYDRQNPSVRGS